MASSLNTGLTILLICLSCIACIKSRDIKFNYCPKGPQENIQSVNIIPCNDQPACKFTHGINVTVQVEFMSPVDSPTLDAEIYGIIAGIPVKFNMPNPNGCSQSGITCPVKKSKQYTYKSTFYVLKSYPNIQLVVQWDLKSANNDYIFCFTFPMLIVS